MLNLKTSHRKAFLYLALNAFAVFLALRLHSRILWNSYHSLIMNDGDSILFLSYVKNLNVCPISTSKLLMIDAISNNCSSLIRSQDFSFYSDHPSGFIIILSFFYRFGFHSLTSMRFISVVVSSLIVLVLYKFCAKYRGPKFGLSVAIGFAITPLFVFHSLVIHIFSWTELWSVVLGTLYVREISRPNKKTKLLFTIFLILGFTIDWPIFILAGVLLVISVSMKRFDLAALLVTCSLPAYFMIRIWISIGNSSKQAGFIEQLVDSIGRGEKISSLALIPIYFMKAHFLGVLGIISFIYFAQRAKTYMLKDPILLLGAILLAQGLLNVILFLPWASSHIYWTYFMIPTSAIGLALILEKMEHRRNISILSIFSLLFVSSYYSYAWWGQDYIKKPLSFKEYFVERGLDPEWISQGSKLYTLDRDIYIGQSAKFRLELEKSFSLVKRENLPTSGFLVTKSENGHLQDLQNPIHLEWFEWDVYKLNKEQN